MHQEQWTKGEKVVARRAFEQAYEREYAALADEVRRLAEAINNPGDIWRLHDFLSEKRQMVDEKYDYRYSVLLFVFARLINEGWLSEAELEGLSKDKLDKIRFMTAT